MILRGKATGLIPAAALAAYVAVLSTPAGPPSAAPAPAPRPAPNDEALLANPCLGRLPCVESRSVLVDYTELGVPGRAGGEWLTYDYDEVTRPLTRAEMADESELSLAVRLVVSEVGADRLLVNRLGLIEAVGILYTVDNRLDPRVYNPEDRAEAPAFPGCGPEGTFYSCANAQQYLGMATWRALMPTWHYDDDLLAQAVDLAVVAWWLQERGEVPDFTEGATNYVHRCGARGYGLTTPHCDAHLGRPRGDVAGANPHTGPTVFKAPEVWSARRGYYLLYESRWVDYLPWGDLDFVPAGDVVADAESDEVLGEGLLGWAPGSAAPREDDVREALRRAYGADG